MLTPIHRALGAEPGDLTIDLLRKAVETGVTEADDLDWKQALYHPKRPNWQDEAAKDIAAMANSGGGWIVFGVDDQDDAAVALRPVAWSGTEEQRLRQVAYARIGPPVVGLTFTVLAVGGGSVVALRDPDSPEAPHLARKGEDAFVAPRRNGAHTVFMSERELEQSYRTRFRTQTDREEALESLYRETARAIGIQEGVCFAFVALPVEALSGASPMTEEQARAVLDEVDHSPYYEGMSAAGGHGDYRRGLRRWISRIRSDRGWRKTLHEDGSVTVAYRLGGWDVGAGGARYYPQGEPNHCMSEHVEHVVTDGVATVSKASKALGVQGGYTVRAGLVGRSGEPIYVRTTEGMTNLLLDAHYAEPIYDFHAVTVDFDPLVGSDALLPIVQEVCLDIVNQGGVRFLRVIFDSPPGAAP